MTLSLQPITLREANEFVSQHHRHHGPAVGHRFSLAVNDGRRVRGVAVVSRPVARHFDDGLTVEVVRLCTDGTPNAPSFLLGACRRAARALGYIRLITYTLPEEGGASLRAAGWKELKLTGGGSWSRKSRLRVDKHPIGQKVLWEAAP